MPRPDWQNAGQRCRSQRGRCQDDNSSAAGYWRWHLDYWQCPSGEAWKASEIGKTSSSSENCQTQPRSCPNPPEVDSLMGQCDAKTESVPLLREVEGQTFARAVSCTDARIIQIAVVIAAEALIQIHHQPTILSRAVRKLVACPVVFPRWNGNLLIDVERRK